MSKHSDRAKKGTITQINAHISFIQTNFMIKKKELSKAMQYKKYKLPVFDTQIARIKQGITKAEKDLIVFQKRKEKLADEGLI